jgi:DNA-directed RNA polymerase specialized sigma subunit
MAARKATELVPTMLRMRESLRKQLERSAVRNDRSMTAEIVHRLERSLQDEEILTEIRNELAAVKKAMMETQDEQFERFLKEWQEQQLADAQGLDDGEPR